MKKALIYFLFIPFFGLFSSPPKAKGLKLISTEEGEAPTQRLAVVVGLNDYTDKNISQLNKARYDAKLFAKTLQDYGQFDQVSLLTDDNDARGIEYPNKKNIETKIEVILSKANPEDFFLFYFSGHGMSDSKKKGYVLPADADTEKMGSDEGMEESMVSVSWIAAQIKKVGIKRSILILDACRDNPTKGTKSALFSDLRSKSYAKSQISAVFYSTKSGLYSYEDPESDNGVFTKYLVEAMMGSADRSDSNGERDNIVTFSEIEEYVTQKVDAWSTKNNKLQKPYIKMNDEFTGSIPITAYEGSPIVVRGQRDKTLGALWRSTLLPGWGQYYKDEPYKAFGFGFTTLAAMGGFAASVSQYQSSLGSYNSAGMNSFLMNVAFSDTATLGLLSYNDATRSRSQVQLASGTASLTGGLLLGIYLLNVLDAGTYRDVNRHLTQTGAMEGWSVVQKREAYAGQMGTYNELGYNWKF
jgi:hypothetical protein